MIVFEEGVLTQGRRISLGSSSGKAFVKIIVVEVTEGVDLWRSLSRWYQDNMAGVEDIYFEAERASTLEGAMTGAALSERHLLEKFHAGIV